MHSCIFCGCFCTTRAELVTCDSLHGLRNPKYLLSGPLKKKTANLWTKMFTALWPWAQWYFITQHHYSKSSLMHPLWKLIPFSSPTADAAVKARGQNEISPMPLSTTGMELMTRALQMNASTSNNVTFFSGSHAESRQQPSCHSDQWGFKRPLILLTGPQNWWATDSVHCQIPRGQVA